MHNLNTEMHIKSVINSAFAEKKKKSNRNAIDWPFVRRSLFPYFPHPEIIHDIVNSKGQMKNRFNVVECDHDRTKLPPDYFSSELINLAFPLLVDLNVLHFALQVIAQEVSSSQSLSSLSSHSSPSLPQSLSLSLSPWIREDRFQCQKNKKSERKKCSFSVICVKQWWNQFGFIWIQRKPKNSNNIFIFMSEKCCWKWTPITVRLDRAARIFRSRPLWHGTDTRGRGKDTKDVWRGGEPVLTTWYL